MLFGARVAYQLVNLARGPWRSKQVEVTRDGLRWSLDLREGIDLSIYLFGAFEPSVVRRYRRLVSPGDVVVDIGANVGAHTLPLARAAGESGRVLAFEPTGWAFEKLQANLALNPSLGPRVTAEHALLVSPDERTVPVGIYSSWPLVTGHGQPDESDRFDRSELHPQHRGMLRGTDGARAVTLDDYLAGAKVDFVKLDVDGAEPEVLAGATATIDHSRPSIVIEMAPCAYEGGDGFERIVEFLTSRHYRLEHLRTRRALPTDADALAARIPDGSSMNVLCVPE
jgi:FkbM family methyltransferase